MSDDRQLFLLDQKIYSLKSGLSEAERKEHVCGAQIDDKAWDAEDRFSAGPLGLVDRALSADPLNRVALVCDAGLGKTTNMEWLQAKLSAQGSRQLAVLIRLDTQAPEDRQPGSPELYSCGLELFKRQLETPSVEHLLDWLAEELFCHVAIGEKARHLAALCRLRAQGRITLLIDGLDHAIGDTAIRTYLKRFLGSDQWRHCPIWIAGRPTAFKSLWNVFLASNWNFHRIAPLAEAEIAFYMSYCAGGNWYPLMTQSHSLVAIPRFLWLICDIIRYEIAGQTDDEARRMAVESLRLNTPADVYCRAFLEVGDEDNSSPHPNTLGLLAQGLDDQKSHIGLTGKEQPSPTNRRKRVERVAALLGALAFEMFPRFSGVKLHPFLGQVAQRVEEAEITDAATFDKEFNLLKEMNIHALDFLLFSESNERKLVFRDRTTLAFFAAYWACHCEKPKKLDTTRKWVVDELFEKNLECREFWQFAAEMPNAGLPRTEDDQVDETRWHALFTPLYAGTVKDSKKRPIRSTEFIFRSWPRMEASTAGRKIIETKYRAKVIPPELLSGFIPLVRGVLPQDSGTFRMGEEDRIREETLDGRGFYLHHYCVTNIEYERFDPRHNDKRWTGSKHKAVKATGDQSADDECPAVMVSWYDAISYARWLGIIRDEHGNRCDITLPSEVGWEYACRAGHDQTRFTFDEAEAIDICTPAYCNYNGNYPDAGAEEGEFRECTLPVDGSVPDQWSKAFKIKPVKGRNRWGFYQMHGNVYEWCMDWYDSEALARVLRGGSWNSFGWYCRSAFRFRYVPDSRIHFYGFRLAAVPCIVGAKSSRSGGDGAAGVVEARP